MTGICCVVATPPPAERRSLFAPVEPFDSGFLDTGQGHRVYWERCGNPTGQPAMVLHGGPGAGCRPDHRRFFDPERYCVLLFDQRGCGRSTPRGSLEANTTWHLVADMERLRVLFGFERMLLFGGSWGSTLALAYAQTFPERVSGLVLRGIFTSRRSELAWLYQDGASHLFPDAWSRFAALAADDQRQDLLGAYRALLRSPHRDVRLVAAKAWTTWERSIAALVPPEPSAAEMLDDEAVLALAAIGSHYFAHASFLEEGQLIANAPRLDPIRGTIVQGRYDVVTPVRTAWDLHRAWPGSNLWLVPDAGHSPSDPALLHHLLDALDRAADQNG